MKTASVKSFSVIIGALLFNWVFWNEKMGINTCLYGLFIIAVLFCLYPNARHSSKVRWLLAGHLLCLAMVLWHNSTLSKVAYLISFALLVPFMQFVHRSIAIAGGSFMENYVFIVPSILELLPGRLSAGATKFYRGRYFRLAVIPLTLAFLFFLIYNIANAAFSSFTDQFLNAVGNFLDNLFRNLSIDRFMFFMVGLVLTLGLLLKNKRGMFSRTESGLSNEIVRTRNNRNTAHTGISFDLLKMVLGRIASGMMALKYLNIIAMVSLVLLNLLLAIINGIDISYLWFGFNPSTVNLYQLIHEGSDVLVMSILMAIAVVVVFFKGNLNFYNKSPLLKTLTYIWLVQNAILVLSVFLRDYYYIREAGLARNRIGLLFYLALVLFGLVTVAWKIHFRKSTYFLFRVNAWAAYFLLVISTTVNWDRLIVQHNLSKKSSIIIPAYYMTTLSPSVLPILEANKETLLEHEILMKKGGFSRSGECVDCTLKNISDRIDQFKHEQAHYSWLSWNWADQQLLHQLNGKSNAVVRNSYELQR